MNLHGLCMFGAADESKIRRLIKVAEKCGVCIIGVQEIWFKKKRHHEELRRALRGSKWKWFGKTRGKQKRHCRGSGGVDSSAGEVTEHDDRTDGVIWVELARAGEVTHVVNVYLVPMGSTSQFMVLHTRK